MAEVRHRPTIHDNLKYWQIFSQDSQIYDFMNYEGEFQRCDIDTECTLDYTINNEIDVNDINKIEPTRFTKLEIEQLETVEIEELINYESKV